MKVKVYMCLLFVCTVIGGLSLVMIIVSPERWLDFLSVAFVAGVGAVVTGVGASVLNREK